MDLGKVMVSGPGEGLWQVDLGKGFGKWTWGRVLVSGPGERSR